MARKVAAAQAQAIGAVTRSTSAGKLTLVTRLEPDTSSMMLAEIVDTLQWMTRNNYGNLRELVSRVVRETLVAAYLGRFRSGGLVGLKWHVGASIPSPEARKRYVLALRKAQARLARLQAEISAMQGEGKAQVSSGRETLEKAVSYQLLLIQYYASRAAGVTSAMRPSKADFSDIVTDEGGSYDSKSAQRRKDARQGRMITIGQALLKAMSAQQRDDARRGKLTVSFGDVAAMDRTPTSDTSKSPMNILWRQLEFGTGLASLAKAQPRINGLPGLIPPRTEGSPFKLPDGSWYFGETRILGTRSGDFLRMRSGLPYERDAVLFDRRLEQELNYAFAGYARLLG